MSFKPRYVEIITDTVNILIGAIVLFFAGIFSFGFVVLVMTWKFLLFAASLVIAGYILHQMGVF
jgi:hypothetical protein